MPSRILTLWLLLVCGFASTARSERYYLGFDRNVYPGDQALPALRKTFDYTSYWLNPPPGARIDTWTGKRELLRGYGFGFLVLFNGRPESALGLNPAALGRLDGAAAAAAAAREGFRPGVRIFLDQEEGGRLMQPQAAYLFAWIDAIRQAGDRPGVYCSGIVIRDESGPISTAQDIARREAERMSKRGSDRHGAERLALWVANDACPPSPGCTVTRPDLRSAIPKLPAVLVPVWQYAQSPRRKRYSAGCPRNTAPDGDCYAPGLPPGPNSFVDLNVADSPDPSEDR